MNFAAWTSATPEAALFKIMFWPSIAKSMAAVAELGIPDSLASSPKTAAALAVEHSLNEEALERILQALIFVEVFKVDEKGAYSNGPLGDALRSDAPASQRDWVIYTASLPLDQIWDRAIDVLRTGKPSPELVFNKDYWAYLQADPKHGEQFHRGMASMTAPAAYTVVPKVDLTAFKTVCDVAGGHGIFLGNLVKKFPHVQGTLFDQASVLAAAVPVLERLGVTDRVESVAGNFFEAVPPGRDLYIMKRTLHDWSDDDSKKILGVCRQAMRKDSELWLVEPVLPNDASPHFARFIDTYMMVLLGGKERSQAQWTALLASGGFKLREVKELDGIDSLIIADPV